MPEARTAEEVLAYVGEDGEPSFLGFDREALLEFLSFDEARPWLKPDATDENWPEPKARTRENALEAAREYMARIALDKAVSHRGLSAGRSIEKLRAWCWLAGDDEAVRLLDETPYENYGAPKLMALCQHFGWDWKATLEGGDIAIFEAQAKGEVCPACLEGWQSGCGN